jgi:hypothetical protein
LGDFIPCLFDSDERFDMHTIPRPIEVNAPIDIGTVYRVIRTTKAALEAATREGFTKALSSSGSSAVSANPSGASATRPSTSGISGASGTSNAGVDPSEYAALVGQAYAEILEPQAYLLVGVTLDQLLLKVTDAATSALLSVKDRYRNTPGFPDLSELQDSAINSTVGTVASAISKGPFQAPNDVSCSMAILTWQETSDIFGRRIANTYIAIQVTVRNLNTTNEFLIHDIQVAVDTGLDPNTFSRFTAGRDKLLVRAVAQRGQSEDRRNLALNSLLALGAISSSVTLLNPANEFATAVAVFQGGFIPGFKTLFPDHTVDQLNHINDLVFSASSVNKVIVPIQGSVPLVTFISTKPVEQMPFAWCGYTKQTRTILGKSRRQECDYGQPEQAGGYPDNYSFPSTQDKNAPPAPWNSLDYKKWKPAALRILQNQTFVVIGGVHIKQLTNEPGKVNSLTCTKLPSGSIDISATKDGFVTCSVTGTNLDSVSSVNLEKGTDKIGGKIKAAKDGNSADLQFDPAALSDGDGIYELMLVDKSSNEVDSREAVQLEVQPLITSADSSLDLAKPALTLKGKHLDKLGSVSLIAEDGSATNGTLATAGADATSISVSFPKGLTSGNSYFVRYKAVGSDNQVPLKTIVVKTTGTAPAAPKAALALSGLAKTVTANTKVNLTVTAAADASGTNFTGAIKFSSSDKAAILPGDYTFKDTDKGKHGNFAVTFKTKGKQTVTVTSGGNSAEASTTVK